MKSKIAGHRKRAFKPRSDQVPEVVHTLMEFVHDMCLELGVCSYCKMRLLHREIKKGKEIVYSKCEECLAYQRVYYDRRYSSKTKGRS